MSAPLIWIVFPIVMAGLMIIFSYQRKLVLFSGIFLAVLLALLAWQLKVDEVIIVGSTAFKIQPQLNVAGRQLVIADSDRPSIMYFYSVLLFWLVGATTVRVPRLFAPLGLLIVAVFLAALAVEPPLFAALLIEIAILISVFMLVNVGERINRGVVRFLIYQTLGMPLILLASWFLGNVQIESGALVDIIRAAIFLALGFAFQFGVFPFHSWIPMLFEKANPFIAAFVVSLLLSVETQYAFGFLHRYPGLQEVLNIRGILQFLGLLMLVLGGLWAAFQKDLTRMIGFTFVAVIGHIFLMLSLEDGIQLFYVFSVHRILAFAIWAVALAVIRTQTPNLRFSSVQGMARRFPIIAGSVVIAQFSIAGIPLLAGFPVLLILWERLTLSGIWPILLSLLGSASLMVGGLRTLAVFVMGSEEIHREGDFPHYLLPRAILTIGILLLFLMGLFPQWFLPVLSSIPVFTKP